MSRQKKRIIITLFDIFIKVALLVENHYPISGLRGPTHRPQQGGNDHNSHGALARPRGWLHGGTWALVDISL